MIPQIAEYVAGVEARLCRLEAAIPPAGESVVPCGWVPPAGADDYELYGSKWPTGEITYSFVPDGTATAYGPSSLYAHLGSRATEAQWKGAIRAALAEWASHQKDLTFREVPDDGARLGSVGSHGQIRFCCAGPRDGSNAAAWAYYPVGSQLSGDVFFHNIYTFGVGEPGYLDVFSIVLHELGHALGIRHSAVAPSVMWPTIGFGPQYAGCYPDDVAAVQSLYGSAPPPPVPDNTTAVFVGEKRAGGDWAAVAGSQGYALAQSASDPQGKPVSLSGNLGHTWAASTADPRAVAVPGGGDRVAACWYSVSPWEIRLPELAAPTDLTLYLLDWDRNDRRQRVEVLDWGGAVLDAREAGDFGGGLYLTYRLAGGCKFRLTRIAGHNAVCSAVLYGGPVVSVFPVVPCPFEVLPDGRKVRALWSEPVRGDGVTNGLTVLADGELVQLITPPVPDPSHEFLWYVHGSRPAIRKGQRVTARFEADPLSPVTSAGGGVLSSFECVAANRSAVD